MNDPKRMRDLQTHYPEAFKSAPATEDSPKTKTPSETKSPEPEASLRTHNRLFDEAKFRACIPAEMLKEKRWVRYFLKPKPEGGTAKVPLGNHSDQNTWSTFDGAVAELENDQQGIGYCLLGGDIHAL